MPKNKDFGQRVSDTFETRWAENARVTQLLKDKLSLSLDNVSMVGNKLKIIKITIPAKHYYYSVSHNRPRKNHETDEYLLFDDKEEIMSCTDDSYVDKFSNYILNKINEELEMNSIYEQMNKIDDKESLNEKYNVRTLKDVKKLQEAEAPKSDRSSIKTRVNELIDMVDWSKWEKFTSTGDDTKPEVKKTKAVDDGIRVDVYLGWDYGHKDDIEEYVKAVNEKFEAFASIVKKQEPSWSVKLVKSHGSRGVTWTNYWAQVTVKNSITESTNVERPKGFKGTAGGFVSLDRYGIFYSAKKSGGGVKISDANYDWIRDNFELVTDREYETLWGKGKVYKLEKKEAQKITESVHDYFNIDKYYIRGNDEDAIRSMDDPDLAEYLTKCEVVDPGCKHVCWLIARDEYLDALDEFALVELVDCGDEVGEFPAIFVRDRVYNITEEIMHMLGIDD